MYEMAQFSEKGYEKCEVEIIDKGRYFWVNSGPERQTYRQQLTPNAECQ